MEKFLTPETRNDLQREHKLERGKRMAYRINTILLLDSGWSYEAIAEALLLDDSTIRRYEQNYLEGGLECLLSDNYKGSYGFLSTVQEQLLKEHICAHTYTATKEIVEYVEKTFGKTYTVGGMLHVLKRLGFVYKKPKRIPGKANAQAQEDFLVRYRELMANKGENTPIYFMDGTHPQHNAIPSCGWILKGHDKEIPTNTGRAKININGAIDTKTMDVVVQESERINADSTIELLKSIEAKNPKAEKIYVIADNARYYRAKKVKEFLKTSKIEILFLPPYAPNLNLIERFWKFFKKKVLYNKYYDTYDKFRKACLNFFDHITDYENELRSLLTDNFQIINA